MGVNKLVFCPFAPFRPVNEMALRRKDGLKTREVIVKLLKEGKSQRILTKLFPCSQFTVFTTLRKFIKLISVKNCPLKVIPRATYARLVYILLNIFKNMRWKTSKDMNIEWKKASKPKVSLSKTKPKPNLT